MQHFSHVHSLQHFGVQHHGEALCDACRRPCMVGPAYRCAPCNYILDKTCARTPEAIRHPGHPDHALTLLVAPPYPGGSFFCAACGGRGTAFYFHYSACEFDLHISCANAPLQLHHPSHPHPLALAFTSPYGGTSFACDVCRRIGGGSTWRYCCAPCGFDAHIECATSAAPPQGYYYDQQQQRHPLQQEQPREAQQPSFFPRSTPQSLQGQPSPQPVAVQNPAPRSQPDTAIDDAVAGQFLAFSMQQAQIQNQMVNSIVQMHNQRMARPFPTWQVEETFVSAPKVPRPDAGGHMSALMQNLTNMTLNADMFTAGAAAPPAMGAAPLSGVLGQIIHQGEGGFGAPPASAGDGNFLASFLRGDDSSGMANAQWNLNPPPSGEPDELLTNLLTDASGIQGAYPGLDAFAAFSDRFHLRHV